MSSLNFQKSLPHEVLQEALKFFSFEFSVGDRGRVVLSHQKGGPVSPFRASQKIEFVNHGNGAATEQPCSNTSRCGDETPGSNRINSLMAWFLRRAARTGMINLFRASSLTAWLTSEIVVYTLRSKRPNK
jgi:hypothetical protein